MIQRGEQGSGEDVFDVYLIYSSIGYTLVGITDHKSIAYEFIKENDNPSRDLFYRKVQMDMESYDNLSMESPMDRLFIDNLCDYNGYAINSIKKWTTMDGHDKTLSATRNIIMDISDVPDKIETILGNVNISDETESTLYMVSNLIRSVYTVFTDEDLLENLSTIFEYIDYDVVNDMVFDHTIDSIEDHNRHTQSKGRTMF